MIFVVTAIYRWTNADYDDFIELDTIPLGVFWDVEKALTAISEIYPIENWRGGKYASLGDYPLKIGESYYEADCNFPYKSGEIIEIEIVPMPDIGNVIQLSIPSIQTKS